MQPLPPELAQSLPQVLESHFDMVERAVLALPCATALGAALAFRPRRRGTPPRSAPVIETQIVLAVVGATVMLVVGSSLARAFGIVGAANLIRYRAKIDDPKDAVVMLSTLSVGLCCGVELYGLALFATVFLLAVLWAVESIEPELTKHFELKVTAPRSGGAPGRHRGDPAALPRQVRAAAGRPEGTRLRLGAAAPHAHRSDCERDSGGWARTARPKWRGTRRRRRSKTACQVP